MSALQTITDTHSVLLSAGWFDTANGWADDGETLLKNAAACIAIFFIIRQMIASFTVTRLVAALLLSGGLLWGVNNVDIIESKVDDDIAATGQVGVVDGPGPISV